MRIFIQLLFLLAFSSCQVMYQTNMQNVPLFKEQGEASITINPSNIQVAYAVTDQVGIMCNGFFQANSWTDQHTTLSNNFYKTLRYNFEAGAGYFIPHGEDGVLEIYAGAGYGEMNLNYKYVHDSSPSLNQASSFSCNALKFFIQPGIGTSPFFAFSSRLVALKINSVRTNFSALNLAHENLQNLSEEPLIFFAEPALTFRIGEGWINFHSQVYYSFQLNPSYLNYRPFGINFGLNIYLAERIRKEKN